MNKNARVRSKSRFRVNGIKYYWMHQFEIHIITTPILLRECWNKMKSVNPVPLTIRVYVWVFFLIFMNVTEEDGGSLCKDGELATASLFLPFWEDPDREFCVSYVFQQFSPPFKPAEQISAGNTAVPMDSDGCGVFAAAAGHLCGLESGGAALCSPAASGVFDTLTIIIIIHRNSSLIVSACWCSFTYSSQIALIYCMLHIQHIWQ